MELKDQKFGIEIELTGISRRRAAEVTIMYRPEKSNGHGDAAISENAGTET